LFIGGYLIDLDNIHVNFIDYTAKQAIDEIINIAGCDVVEKYVFSCLMRNTPYVDDDLSDDNFIYNG
jgi:hypothetical protein